MVLANNMLKGQADGYCQNSFPLHQRKIELVLPAAFPTLFSLRLRRGKFSRKRMRRQSKFDLRNDYRGKLRPT